MFLEIIIKFFRFFILHIQTSKLIIFQYAYKKLPIENLCLPLLIIKIMTHLRWIKQDGQNKNRVSIGCFMLIRPRHKSFSFDEIRNTQEKI